MKPVPENESRHLGQNEMAGLKGKSGPPGNMNAFKHGLAAIQKRREESIITEHEESKRPLVLAVVQVLVWFVGRKQLAFCYASLSSIKSFGWCCFSKDGCCFSRAGRLG